MRNLLTIIILSILISGSSGCAALWVADKTVETAWFATKTTAKLGAGAAELTWDAGSAAVDAATTDEEEKQKQGHANDAEDD